MHHVTKPFSPPNWQLLLVMFVFLPVSLFPQTTLTGAVQFSANSAGAASGGQVWNTLGGDSYFDLWLAQNPDASSPVNGPSDSQAGISIPLQVGNAYTFYIFGAPGCCSEPFNGLNLFFDGNSSAPGISAFGATNRSGFAPNANTTLTLGGTAVGGAGKLFNSDSSGIVAVLSNYVWNTPATPPGDVSQPKAFTPGGGASYFGSFTLQAWPAATLTLSHGSGAPLTVLTLTGTGFSPSETVRLYVARIGSSPALATTAADLNGSFSVTVREPQLPLGPVDVYALGLSSHRLGASAFSVTPVLAMNPAAAAPGSVTTAYVLGFGAGEAVDIYWNEPRQLLSAATADGVGSSSSPITIPANASPGTNVVIGVGQRTKAIGLGTVKVP